MLEKVSQWLRATFAAKAQSKPAIAETAMLDTRHGPVRMDRAVLSCGSVAYICHTASRPENATLDIDRVEYLHTDRNTGESHDVDNVMAETNDNGHKSDFWGAAEQFCNGRDDMTRAIVVVFFDHKDVTGVTEALQELRHHFPATNPAQDRMERQQKVQQPTRPPETPPKRAVTYHECGPCG